MLSAKNLIKKVKSYDKAVDVDRLSYACDFSKEAHGLQKRASGDPYYYHPLAVADILADMKFDIDSIITALLHDTVEDTDVTLKQIKKEFGTNVANLVDGVTKLTKIEYQTEHYRQAENFRKLLLAMSEDIRVLIVKLADRLHNMRTLHFKKSPEKRLNIAHETMEIYAPLAERIGMQQIKNELQDLAFAELHPEARESILSRLEYLKNKGSMLIDNIISNLNDIIIKSGVSQNSFEIFGRAKTPCSIWRKMERKNISFELLSDIIGFRIIAKDVLDCYKILGIIHTNFQMIPESFKDFISTPKNNGYQSLHTVIMGPGQRFIEIQIRTKEMHEVADLGVAAHWSYKQNHKTDGKQYKWIRELLHILEHAADSEDFLVNTKLEMYYDQVFCFTPKGELIALPKGATAVDFAYVVHSNIGHHCSGVKINGRVSPLRTQLLNGDQVEIITSKTQVPSPEWEKFVVTGKARSEINRFVRAQKRKEFAKLGENLLNQDFEKESIKLTKTLLNKAQKSLNKKNLEELYCAIGEGVITTSDVMKVIFPNKKIKEQKVSRFSFFKFPRRKNKNSNSIPIKGLIPGMAVYFAECCHPIPGDSIVGVTTTGKGVTIHTSDCRLLENFSSTPERLRDLSWGKSSSNDRYNGRIKAILANTPGSLASLTSQIAKSKANITNLKISDRSSDFFEVLVDVSVLGDSQLSNIISSLKGTVGIHKVLRDKK